MALATVDAVQREGSFRREQFGLESDGELAGVIADRIAEASAEVRTLVGSTLYGTGDSTLRQVLTTAEVYLATAKLLQTILNIMATWDAEPLPTEFVDREGLPLIVERYRRDAQRLLAPYSREEASRTAPYFVARGG